MEGWEGVKEREPDWRSTSHPFGCERVARGRHLSVAMSSRVVTHSPRDGGPAFDRPHCAEWRPGAPAAVRGLLARLTVAHTGRRVRTVGDEGGVHGERWQWSKGAHRARPAAGARGELRRDRHHREGVEEPHQAAGDRRAPSLGEPGARAQRRRSRAVRPRLGGGSGGCRGCDHQARSRARCPQHGRPPDLCIHDDAGARRDARALVGGAPPLPDCHRSARGGRRRSVRSFRERRASRGARPRRQSSRRASHALALLRADEVHSAARRAHDHARRGWICAARSSRPGPAPRVVAPFSEDTGRRSSPPALGLASAGRRPGDDSVPTAHAVRDGRSLRFRAFWEARHAGAERRPVRRALGRVSRCRHRRARALGRRHPERDVQPGIVAGTLSAAATASLRLRVDGVGWWIRGRVLERMARPAPGSRGGGKIRSRGASPTECRLGASGHRGAADSPPA